MSALLSIDGGYLLIMCDTTGMQERLHVSEKITPDRIILLWMQKVTSTAVNGMRRRVIS